MRVLLDECVPKRVRTELSSHSVRTVTEMRWAGIKNGQLLKKAASVFDCFLTVDQNLQFQQAVDNLPLAVIVIRADDNRIGTLRPLMAAVRDALHPIGANELQAIGLRGTQAVAVPNNTPKYADSIVPGQVIEGISAPQSTFSRYKTLSDPSHCIDDEYRRRNAPMHGSCAKIAEAIIGSTNHDDQT